MVKNRKLIFHLRINAEDVMVMDQNLDLNLFLAPHVEVMVK